MYARDECHLAAVLIRGELRGNGRYLLISWHRIRIWAEEAFAVKVDEMVGGFGDPHFGLPRDLAEEGLHGFAGFEGGDEDEAGGGAFEQLFKLGAAFAVHGAGAGDGFDEDQPISLYVVDDDIGHLGGGVQGDAELGEIRRVEVEELGLGVAQVDHHAAGCEDGREVLDHGFDQRVLAAGGECKLAASR